MVASQDLFCHNSNLYFTLDIFGEYSHSFTIFFPQSALITHLPHLTPFSFALHYFANVRSSTCLFIYFRGSLPEFDHTSPLMYDFPISSSSPIFDMLVKWLLEIHFNLPFWIYLSFTLFTMCLEPLLSFQINAALDSSLNF